MDIKVFEQFNNLIAGFTTKPDKSDIRREEMVKAAKQNGSYVVRPKLVHGDAVLPITAEILSDSYIECVDVDGLITDLKGVRLTSTHGDCIPIYAFDSKRNVIGLAHAGWKGTALGIAGKMISSMKNYYKCNPLDIWVFIGPGIDKCHFEFGEKEALQYFFDRNPWTKDFSYSNENPDKLYLDLKGINKQFVFNEGVVNIELSPECTYCNKDKFYSYRRSKDTDRMLAYIEMK